jgi:HAE1 family hydrophobic/amphiphilic exporter-1
MQAFGFSLNIITLLALTLVIGILVDDAIVEIENIEKRIATGETPYRAAMIGADAIGLAVVATTASIVAIFIPVSFMGGQAGQFFQEFGLTVAAAVIFSLLVARFVIPILAAYILQPSKRHDSHGAKLPRYPRLLGWSLRHPWLTVGISASVFVAGVALAITLPLGFQPVGDPGYVNISVSGPIGATKEEMERPLASFERYLLKRGDVLTVFTQFGSTSAGRDSLPGSSTATDLASGSITVVLRPDRKISTNMFQSAIQEALRVTPDVRLTIEGSATNTGVEVVLAGTDFAALGEAQRELVREMRTLPSIRNPLPLPPPSSPELVIVPRTEIASQLGVTAEDIARTVRIGTIGEADSRAAKLTTGEHRIPIRTKMAVASLDTLQRVGELKLPLSNGSSTSLSAVANYFYSDGPGRIIRYDRERRVSVRAELTGASLGQALQEIRTLKIMRSLPPGVRAVEAGDSEAMSELVSGFLFAILFGVILVYSVLVLLFKDGIKPAVILCAIPLSMIGAFIVLKIFSIPVTLPVFIGVLMLFGLATKNSILLVELAAFLEREGKSRHEALLLASAERSRPIIMTTFAMIAGMIPTALGIGEGSAFRQPMALAVIGGLLSSTALSLLLVPALYESAERVVLRLKGLKPFVRRRRQEAYLGD